MPKKNDITNIENECISLQMDFGTTKVNPSNVDQVNFPDNSNDQKDDRLGNSNELETTKNQILNLFNQHSNTKWCSCEK